MDDLAVLDRDDVTALDRDPRVVGGQPLEAPGTGEGGGRRPAHRGAPACGGEVDDLEGEIGKRREQRREVPVHAVGRDQVALADEAIDAAGLPQRDGRLDVVARKRVEVGLGGLDGGGHEPGQSKPQLKE